MFSVDNALKILLVLVGILFLPLPVEAAYKSLAGSGGGTPGGTNGQIQYNNAGAFGGESFVPINNGGTPFNVVMTAAPYNASGFIAQTTTSGVVTSGSTVIPVNSTMGFNLGHVVIISLAGTSGTKNFAGFISSISAGVSITISNTAVTGALLPATSTSGTTGTATTISAGYIVYSLGTTTLSGAVVNGATSIPLTDAATYQLGHGVLITGGKTGGADLITQITGVSGNTLTISPGISNVSGVASGVNVQHDDTAAFQAAVNLVTPLLTVNIFVPDGYYQINGPADVNNIIIRLPSYDYFSGGGLSFWNPPATLMMSGNVPAPQEVSYIASQKIPHESGAIIQTKQGNAKSLFAAYNIDGVTWRNFSNIRWVVQNLTFRTPPNPQISMLNGTYVTQMQVTGVDISTDDAGATTQPTDNASSGANAAIFLPYGGNAGLNVVSQSNIMGWMYGIESAEHTGFYNVFYPMLVDGDANTIYGTTGVEINFNGCPHGIDMFTTGQTHGIPFDISLLNIEHNTNVDIPWANAIDDILDTGSVATGFISIDANPNTQTIVVTNATKLHVADARAGSYPLPTATFANLSNSHYTSAPAGFEVYCSNCTIATTCAGSGSGAYAISTGSGWSCSQGVKAEQTISYQPGLLSAVNATKGVYGKFVNASTVDNIEGSAITFSCVSNPTITLTNCHADTSCATTPTVIGTVTVTAAGQAFDGSISNAAIAAGEYVAWSITAGTCASIDVAATAQVHNN